MMHSSETLVQATGIYVERGGLVILTDIDASVEPGEIVTLVGLNGSGKTTLVRVLAGLMQPDRGRVQRRPGLKIGYCPQRAHADQNLPMTAIDFLNLVEPARGMTAMDALKEVGIEGLAKRQLVQLSGGEYQRLMLARAILRDPDLLILDEPFAGVDIAGQGELYELIPRIRDRHHCGVILVSHDIHVVMASTDRVICLNHHVCCSGQPEAVAKHPEFVSLFGDQVAGTLAVYRHQHDHAHDLHGDEITPNHAHDA
jgi:zinc transport system ATP-binding protein